MEAYTFNIKGFAKISFAENKPDMKPEKVWKFISTIWKHFPEKITLGTSIKRGSREQTQVDDLKISNIMSDMIAGCVETCGITTAGGKSVNILLGSCYEYTLPFGTMSVDTGHQTMITVLPLPLDGCYVLSGSAEGYFRRSEGKEHYMINISLDIYVGKLSSGEIDTYIEKGHKVYPMLIRHPEHFPKPSTSDSEMETEDPSDTERIPEDQSGKQLSTNMKRKLHFKKSIMKKRAPNSLSLSSWRSALQAGARKTNAPSIPDKDSEDSGAPEEGVTEQEARATDTN